MIFAQQVKDEPFGIQKNAGFEMLPPSLFEKTVAEIRERKGPRLKFPLNLTILID